MRPTVTLVRRLGLESRMLQARRAELLEALTRRDPDAAAAAMAEDVHQGMVQIRAAVCATAPPDRFD